MKLNISLRLMYISTTKNTADAPSRLVSSLDCTLHPDLWQNVQREFSGQTGHTCNLMALDSNAMVDLQGNQLPHFTHHPAPASLGVNVFAQDLSRRVPFLEFPLCFLHSLVGPILHLLKAYHCSCTLVTMDIYPLKYWWPLYLWPKETIRLC